MELPRATILSFPRKREPGALPKIEQIRRQIDIMRQAGSRDYLRIDTGRSRRGAVMREAVVAEMKADCRIGGPQQRIGTSAMPIGGHGAALVDQRDKVGYAEQRQIARDDEELRRILRTRKRGRLPKRGVQIGV